VGAEAKPGAAGTAALELLARGEIAVKGRLPWASNATFLVEVTRRRASALGVYKPQRGERPLWDFPRGLYKREVAAYRLSEVLGWSLVPPTFEREGPYGPGSIQLFVDAEFEEHYFTLRQRPELREALARLCAFDLITNNADRKSGHCLLGRDGRLHAIDNGLCFHAEPKLRTVVWDFAGEPVPEDLRADVSRLAAHGLPGPLADLLAPEERVALVRRARVLGDAERFPEDGTGMRYPWPLV
jgi:uncharacterized repeat protein (TIGR03843 family)